MLLRSLLPAACLFAVACNEAGPTEIARGNVLVSRGKTAEAIEAYQAAARELPHKAQPRELLGHALLDQKRYAEARAAYQDAVAVEPPAIEARLGLARLATETGDLKEAFEQLDQVLRVQPQNLYALLSRANLELKRGGDADLEQALVDTGRAVSLDAKSEPVLFARGEAFLATRRLDEARQAFELLRKEHPRSPLGWYGLARVAAAAGDRATAIADLQKARASAAEQKQPWKPDEVRADPAFRSLSADPAFASAVGS